LASADRERRQALTSRFVLAPVVLLLLSGCHRTADQADGVTIEADVLPQPVRVGAASVNLKMLDVHKKPVTGAHIELEGDMSHPGMAPVFGEARETDPGYYRGNLQFSMAGDWVVMLHITLADGRTLERQVPVKGVGSN
jgi:hypothetical protein